MPDNNPAPDPNAGEGKSYFGLIMTGAIVAMLVIWTYIFFGMDGVSIWMQIGATIVVLLGIVAALKFRRQREQKQLDVLQQWADKESSAAARPRRR